MDSSEKGKIKEKLRGKVLAKMGTLIPSDFNSDVNSSAWWWWAAILWATAATALHSIMQQSDNFPEEKRPAKLELSEDPLTYLGILVDSIQVWDRYTVSHESVIGGNTPLPIQAIDVKAEHTAEPNDAGKPNPTLTLTFRDSKVADNIRKELNQALVDWDKYVEIKPIKPD